jgi:2-keto-4-pentenoate hydratase
MGSPEGQLQVQDGAERLLDALRSHQLIGVLSDQFPTLDQDAAYAIAFEICRRRVERGETPVGRKIGFTNRNIWEYFGVWEPIWGHVYDSTVHFADDGDAQIDIGHLLQPRIEPEIILHFARNPPVSQDEAAILDSIDWIAHGFEIVQCPFPDWRFTAVDTIAAFGLHGALVIGTPVPVAQLEHSVERLRSFTIELFKDGQPKASGRGADVLDSPLLAFAHLAGVLAGQSRSPQVQAGELVTTGTLTDALSVRPGETWSTRLEGIDLPGLSLSLV